MKVLLAADGSDSAVRAAMSAGAMIPRGADVRVVFVLSYSLYPYMQGDPDPEVKAQRERAVEEETTQATEKAVLALEQAGHRPTLVRHFGHPTDEIVREIEDWEPDLVVLGRRGLRGARAWVGSTSEHVLHHAKVPVLLVP